MYYLIEITNTVSGLSKAVWDKENMDLAVMSLHQTFAYAMANTNVLSCLCMIIDAFGGVHRQEYWERTNLEPEVEPEEE